MVDVRYYPDKKGQLALRSYINGWAKPKGRFWKRSANKKFRKANDVGSGNLYKKEWGWFEWN